MPLLRILLILCFLSLGSVNAQSFLRVDHSEFAGENVEGKELLKNISKAKKLFDKGESSYLECLELLMECNYFNNANAELNYNIGLCYLKYGGKHLAKPYFEQVKALKPNVNSKLYLYLGQACQYASDYSDAILNYKTYSEIIQKEGGKRKNEELKLVAKYIEACKTGQILLGKVSDFGVEKMPEPINTDANDILAIKDGAKLFFISDRILDGEKKTKKDKSLLRGFSVVLLNGEWSSFSVLNDEKKSVDLPIMVDKVDVNRYLFYDKNEGRGDLVFMQKDEKFWIKEMDVFFVNEKKSNETSASFTSDGKTVAFVSNRDGGQGDIFFCQMDSEGEWSKPVKFGVQINSDQDEKDVFLSDDGNVIYFSSKGHNSIGGYDIFKSEKDENGNWMEAQNMGIPINSPYDDCHFYLYEGDSFLFDSNRGENGKFDIYTKKFIEKEVKEEEKIEVTEPVAQVEVLPEVVPVPVQESAEPVRISYRIQIAASKKELKNHDLNKLYRGYEDIESSFDGEWYRYTIGNYDSLEDAIYFKDRSGVEKAFIVSFENEMRKEIITNYSLSNR